LVRARIAREDGVDGYGIVPPRDWGVRYVANGEHEFGRDLTLRCPFWVGGEFACGIWEDRGAICRTWFCKHDGGAASVPTWRALKGVYHVLEGVLSQRCFDLGEPPEAGASVDVMEDWYLWCADVLDDLAPEELEVARDARLDAARDELIRCVGAPRAPMSDVLVPRVRTAERRSGRVWLVGYSSYDGLDAPAEVFELLSRLDGERTWRAALQQAEAASGAYLGEALVRELYRVAVIGDPGEDASDWKPNPGSHMTFRRDGVPITAAKG
jgi:hypothetical protein